MEIISKDKPKGKAHGTLKKMRKAKRLLEEKDNKRRTEHKRQNSEARKQRAVENEYNEKVSDVIILGYSKGMLRVLIDGKEEKRSLAYGRRNVDLVEVIDYFPDFELKLYGEMVKIKKLKNYSEKKEEIIDSIKLGL